jgi:hypothetical protein
MFKIILKPELIIILVLQILSTSLSILCKNNGHLIIAGIFSVMTMSFIILWITGFIGFLLDNTKSIHKLKNTVN